MSAAECSWAMECRQKAVRLLDPLRAIAREHGYALTSHGSFSRDIDLVAIPWTEEAVPAEQLAEAIRIKAAEVVGLAFIAPHEEHELPRHKPHGRLCWSFHLGGGPYIDLSVMPRDK